MYNKKYELQTQTAQASKTNPESLINSPKHSKHTQIKKKTSVYARLQDLDKLWKQSSLSLTRDRSPSHKIPQTIRFKPLHQYQKKNKKFLTLQLRQYMKSDRSINFPKSGRPEHWVKGLGDLGPSPASYNCERFMEDSHYKSIEMKEANHTTPLAAFYQTQKTRGNLRGQSFKKFENYHKTFLQHTQHRFYQPENIEGQPGPGQYAQNWTNKPKSKSYSIRPTLTRFNESPNGNPGPGTYYKRKNVELSSLAVKGTIPRSQREYLTKFQDFPSPNHYAIHRFLQQYS